MLVIAESKSKQINICNPATPMVKSVLVKFPHVFFSLQSETFITVVASRCSRVPSANSPSTPLSLT